jgi:cell division protein FtsB
VVGEAGRSASRPASARRAAATGAAKRTRAPEPGGGRFTGRVTALAFVLVVLLLAYAYPVRIYLNQQAQIAALESSQAAQRLRIQQKQGQVAKWNDTEYIIAMAHKRLQMVLPGDVVYLVTDPSVADQNLGGDPDAGKAKDTGPWYGQLWSSLQAADKPRTGP